LGSKDYEGQVMSETVVQARGLSKAFGRGEGLVRAVKIALSGRWSAG
jgi:hypothetical protein